LGFLRPVHNGQCGSGLLVIVHSTAGMGILLAFATSRMRHGKTCYIHGEQREYHAHRTASPSHLKSFHFGMNISYMKYIFEAIVIIPTLVVNNFY
jgi:hypothetical protein